jgi:methylated-DNA-[protein]-cysteine S-methyltransferase
MSAERTSCAEIEPALLAAAVGEGTPSADARVHEHLRHCAPCQRHFDRYLAIDHAVRGWRHVAPPAVHVRGARERLESLLADLRRRTLVYRVFASPIGPLLIARSDEGVSMIEYLRGGTDLAHSRLARLAGVEAIEDRGDMDALYRDLLDYLEGRRTRFEWPIDLRLVSGDFHRSVLAATARIPYGAVISYAGIAAEIGKPSAARAVAQALRRNPLPIVVPCHRVVGSSGALVGYAGDKVALKQQLLAVEGIQAFKRGTSLTLDRDAMYVLTPDGHEYCLPTCSWLESVEQPQRLVRFGSRDRAEATGLTPCGDCRPDLHPLAR